MFDKTGQNRDSKFSLAEMQTRQETKILHRGGRLLWGAQKV